MSRPAKYNSEEILDIAAQIVAERGPAAVTVPEIASRLGAASGSIYYRFESRDLILAHVWVRTVRRAQAGFLEALKDKTLGGAVRAALHIPRWSRDHLPEATLLVLYRKDDLASRWPEDLGDELAELNDAVEESLHGLTASLYGKTGRTALETVVFALVDVPYAAVRRYLVAGKAPPPSVDGLVERTVAHLLDR